MSARDDETDHGWTLCGHFGFSLSLMCSVIATGGALSPNKAYNSRVIPSGDIQHVALTQQKGALTWTLLYGFLLLRRSWLPIGREIEHVTHICGSHIE